MGLKQFRTHLFTDKSLESKVLEGACDLIDADRGAQVRTACDTSLLREAIELFHNLDIYTKDFEPFFLSRTNQFTKAWVASESEKPLASYVGNAHKLIASEVARCGFYSLNSSTKQKLSDLLDSLLIGTNKETLLKEGEVITLMDQASSTHLSLQQLYRLLARENLGTELKPAFRKYIIETGTSIVFDDNPDANMVKRLLAFKKRLDVIASQAFDGDEELGHCLRDAFGHFMNLGRKSAATGGTDNPKTGEMIAKYVDYLLKHGPKALPPGQEDTPLADSFTMMRQQLDQVLDLFRFVQGKAVFEAFYKNDLARRLLMNRSANEEAEKEMLVLLKKGSKNTDNFP